MVPPGHLCTLKLTKHIQMIPILLKLLHGLRQIDWPLLLDFFETKSSCLGLIEDGILDDGFDSSLWPVNLVKKIQSELATRSREQHS